MLRVPDYKVREIFLMLGASEGEVDSLVTIFQTRHAQPLPLESRVAYFNFLGIEDSWERIVHAVRGEHLDSIVDFILAQSPDSLTYKRGIEKLCQFIFSPNLVDQLEEMWHRHTFHTHDPEQTWERTLEILQPRDTQGRTKEDLIGQLFDMPGKSPLVVKIMAEYAGQKKPFTDGVWRPLSLEERLTAKESANDAFTGWLEELPSTRDAAVKSTEVIEFEDFIKALKRKAKTAQDVQVIFECIRRFEKEEGRSFPELTTYVRRFFFEKFLEPYRTIQYR